MCNRSCYFQRRKQNVRRDDLQCYEADARPFQRTWLRSRRLRQYPEYKELYALHLFFDSRATCKECEVLLKERFEIVNSEIIPTRTIPAITDEPIIWRYFVAPLKSQLSSMQLDEKEFVARTVMKINTELKGAYVFSSGKNMGTFKAVGFPEDVGVFY